MSEKENINLYEVRKTVRFELKPEFDKDLIKPKYNWDFKENLKAFVINYEKMLLNFSKVVFDFNKNDLNKKLKIKFSFLKNYTKREYYDNNIERLKKWNNQIEIWKQEFNYLLEKFKIFEINNKLFLDKIKDLWFRGDENQARNSDLAYFFHQISRKTNFDFVKELFENINIESEISKIIDETKILNKEIEKLILNIEKTLLPSQSMWQVIEKASFNYYTVNKKPKDYDKEIENKKNDFDKILDSFKDRDWRLKFNLDNHWFKNYISNKRYSDKTWELTIENAYKLMKEYKAEQKSNFLEYLSEIAKWNSSNLNISLFDDILDKVEFKEIIDLTKSILILSQAKTDVINLKDTINKEEKEYEINESLEKYNNEFWNDFWKIKKENFFQKITDLKKERWQYFFEWNKQWKCKFDKYKIFCKKYKDIAMEYWRIKALIKSLEKEKVDAEKTQSWALVLEQNNNKYLFTIPKNKEDSSWEKFKTNLQLAKEKIDNLENLNTWEIFLYKFESLTLSALDKLCFWKENNSFRPTLIWNIINEEFLNQKWKLKDKFEFTKYENGEKVKDENLLLEFYKTVLNLESTQKQIVIKYFIWFQEFIKKDFENLDEFEEELKKVCYIREKKIISNDSKEQIIKNFEARLYKITSYDLAKNDIEILQDLKYKKELNRKNPKNLTQIWWDFWTEENQKNKFPIRLNPEIKISFVEKKEKFIENHSELPFNRKFHDKFIFTTSFTQNALSKWIDLNFKETDEILKFYKNYNNKFNKENNFKYFYWLDRWENELVSLWIFDFSKDKLEEKWVKIKAYELKESCFEKADEKWKLPYKNISYFIDEKYKDYFEEKEVSCIDLTKAKLIKWKIYLNWDISSYLNLKMISAKRKIYDLVSTSKNKSTQIICKNDYKIIIDLNDSKNEVLYFYDKKYINIISKENIINELQKYLENVKSNLSDNQEVFIEKVNNLRDAICANMVWIINFLQEKENFPWMIFFEDFELSKKQSDFEKNNTTLWSRIEMKLLQKFASLSQIPPNYKQIFSLQSDKKLYQLWIIWYINKEHTSKACPKCNETLFWHWYWPDFEKSMKHLKNEEYEELKNENMLKSDDRKTNKYLPWTINWKPCDFYLQNPNYKEFNFLTSWDDLATYNIAKKWLEYLKNYKS